VRKTIAPPASWRAGQGNPSARVQKNLLWGVGQKEIFCALAGFFVFIVLYGIN